MLLNLRSFAGSLAMQPNQQLAVISILAVPSGTADVDLTALGHGKGSEPAQTSNCLAEPIPGIRNK
jgi:hypothetical protein